MYELLQDFSTFFILLTSEIYEATRYQSECTIRNNSDGSFLGIAFGIITASVFVAPAILYVIYVAYQKHNNSFIAPFTSATRQNSLTVWESVKALALSLLPVVPLYLSNEASCTTFNLSILAGVCVYLVVDGAMGATHRDFGENIGISSLHVLYYALAQAVRRGELPKPGPTEIIIDFDEGTTSLEEGQDQYQRHISYRNTKHITGIQSDWLIQRVFRKFGELFAYSVFTRKNNLPVRPLAVTRYHEACGRVRYVMFFFRIIFAPVLAVLINAIVRSLIEDGFGVDYTAIIAVYLVINTIEEIFFPVLAVFYGPFLVSPDWIEGAAGFVYVSQALYVAILVSIIWRGSLSGFVLLPAIFLYACSMTAFVGYFALISDTGFFVQVANLFNRLKTGEGFVDWVLRFTFFNDLKREMTSIDRDTFIRSCIPGLIFWWYSFFRVSTMTRNTIAGRITYFGQIRLPPNLPDYTADFDEFELLDPAGQLPTIRTAEHDKEQ